MRSRTPGRRAAPLLLLVLAACVDTIDPGGGHDGGIDAAAPPGACVGQPGFRRCDSHCTPGTCAPGYECVPVPHPAQPSRSGPESEHAEAAGLWPVACRRACDPDGAATCQAGSICAPLATDPSRGACAARCTDDASCGVTGLLCDTATGRCTCTGDPACREAHGARARCGASGECVCTPSCGGRECGDDGCGGSCGACAAGSSCLDGACGPPSCGSDPTVFCPGGGACPAHSTCTSDAGCVCDDGFVPTDCSGAGCGWRPDGRWASCPSSGWSCQRCTPNCEGRQCGPDGCGGICVAPEPAFPSGAVWDDGCWQDYAEISRQHTRCDEQTGACVTRPCNCDGRDCGPNSCGAAGACGACSAPTATCDEHGWCVIPDACASATTCDECLSHQWCGWCWQTGTCRDVYTRGWDGCSDGTAVTCDRSCGCENVGCGPLRRPDGSSCDVGDCGLCPVNHLCNRATGQCYPNPSVGVPCSARTSCDACVAGDGCGFCWTDGRCAGGDYDGPRDGAGCDAWAWLGSECVPWTPPGCSCRGLECGPNSCGDGSCGNCSGGAACVDGLCDGGGTPGGCTSHDACLTVVRAVSGAACGTPGSLEVFVRNDCDFAVSAWIRIRRADGTCSRDASESLAPGRELRGYACDARDGSYRVAGYATEDFGTAGCSLDDC